MPLDFARIVELLEHDVARTLGESHRPVVHAAARAVERLALTEPGAKLIEDVPQSFHDRFFDTIWPARPRPQHTHPLEYGEGVWWCPPDRVLGATL